MARPVPPALVLLALAAPTAARAADFQHALVIIADDLGTDKVSSYAGDVDNPVEDRPSTPNLDMLAAAGVRFTDAWASPACSPTRVALYTGEYSYRNGIGAVITENNTFQMDTTPDTLEQLAADAGLATGLFGKWHAGETSTTPDAATSAALDYAEYPIQTGFQYFSGNTDGSVASYTNWLHIQSVPSASASSGYSTTAVQNTSVTATDQTTLDALAWMDARSAAGERRLTVVSYHLPHSTRGAMNSSTWADAAASCGGSTGDETADFKIATECLDDELAELLAGTPDLEQTVVIFLGDNGTEEVVAEGNFADTRGKTTVFESGVRVPFFVVDGAALRDTLDNGGVLPEGGLYALDAGVARSEPAATMDVYATLADLLDLSSSSCEPGVTCGVDSVSLRSVLEGGPAEREEVWTEIYNRSSGGVYTGSAALRVGDLKLVVRVTSSTSPCRDYDLYDLSTDRWEEDDLFGDAAWAVERADLRARLDAEVDRMDGTAVPWLQVADCSACSATEVWYDGVDSDCFGDDDYDVDLDGAQWPADCDDLDPTVYPGAPDAWYDGVDADCAGDDDFDADLDGFQLADDCDDTRDDVWPGAPETAYDGVDADCLGDSDFDLDGDGFDADAWGGTDCDDADAAIWPGAPEASGDGIDSDCDGTVEILDGDGDGWTVDVDCDDTDPATWPGAPEVWYDGVNQDCGDEDDYDQDGDGYHPTAWGGTDCDDTQATVHAGATDTWYDGVDSNCDGRNDYDRDGDGYPSSSYGGTDCNDTNSRIKPGARDTWYDGVDSNCDGRNDYDKDGDGYTSSSYGGTDCDDARASVKPGATEIWYDGVDQNCDGRNDYDKDGDGWPRDTDCNDNAPRIYPGAAGWNLDCTRA